MNICHKGYKRANVLCTPHIIFHFKQIIRHLIMQEKLISNKMQSINFDVNNRKVSENRVNIISN